MHEYDEPDSPEPGETAVPAPSAAPGPRPCAEVAAELGEVAASLLKRAGIFPMFSVHNPRRPNIPMYSSTNPGRLVGIKVFEEMHRFVIRGEEPDPSRGIRAFNRVGEPVASIEIDWRVIPDDFLARPDQLPPPTELDPTRSQRFAMYSGVFRYKDDQKSGFHGFGTGRTFPVVVDGRPQLRVGAVVDILSGFGKLCGARGNVVINGFIEPPTNLGLGVLLRVVDHREKLAAQTGLSPLRTIPTPDQAATFLAFLGEADPDRPVTLNTTPDGRLTGATVHELLRLARIDFDVNTANGLRSKNTTGTVAGSLQFSLSFDGADPTRPVPLSTSDSLFTFFDRYGRTLGTLEANVVEGWGFWTPLDGVPPPVVRVVGFGPFRRGTGAFADISGMLSLNGIISIGACTPSILYVLRVADPNHQFRAFVTPE